MSAAQFSAVVQYLRKLTGVPRGQDETDGELLGRFALHGEEDAFAALVKRHGPMVFGVCRQVLRDTHDAEDAFQAAFLVLARKAGTLAQPDLLGNWLHGVAYRVASDARAYRQRRQAREKQGVEMDTVLARAEGHDDVAPVHEEIQRLPDKYRLPLVLCLLEGQTRAEAARRLGVPAGTVGSRLARARELLRGRLLRRGLVFSAGGFATVLGQTTAPAAVPAALVQSTVKAAVLVAAGKAAAGVVSAKAVALTEGVLKAMFVAKVKVMTVVLLTIGVVGTGAGTFAYQRYGPGSTDASIGQVALAAPAGAPKEQPQRQAKKVEPPIEENQVDATTITGQVLDEQGKPLADCPIDVLANPPFRITKETVKPLKVASAKTDAQGNFRLAVSRFTRQGYSSGYVLASALGYGLGWYELDMRANRHECIIKLPHEQIVRGRFLDLQGQPAANVTVHLSAVLARVADRYKGPGYYWGNPPDKMPSWPVSPTTDNEGRFSLRGVGPGMTLGFHVQDDRYATQHWRVEAGTKTPPDEIVLTLAPAQVVEGQVTYEDTGKPVPRARLLVLSGGPLGPFFSSHGFADAKGRYRLNPYAGEFLTLTAFPPEGEPYLSRTKDLPWIKGTVKQEVNFTLPRGVLLRGRLTETASGEPVAGALLEFRPRRGNNPNYREDLIPRLLIGGLHERSGPDGRFQFAAPPGPGHLLAKGPSPDYLHIETSYGELEYAKSFGTRFYPDGMLTLDLKPGVDPPELAVKLRRGVTVKGKVLTPDGMPTTNLQLACRTYLPYNIDYRANFLPVRDGRFEVPGLDPEKTHSVFFFDTKNQLGATIELSGKQAREDVNVRLAPCGSARVRFVDPDGKPYARQTLYQCPSILLLMLTPGQSTAMSYDKDLQADSIHVANMDGERYADLRTDANGFLTFPALIPGAPYRLLVSEAKKWVGKKDFTVEAGKMIELPDVVIKRDE